MKEDKYRSTLATARGDSKFYKITTLLLVVVVMFQTIVVFSQVGEQRTIIVPPEIEKSFWVEKGKVSQEYLEQMALFIAQLQLTVAPSSYDFQSRTVLSYVHPAAVGAMKSDLQAIGSSLKTNNMATWFKPDQVQTSLKSNRVVVGGELVTYVGEKEVSRRQKSYRAQFSYVNGRIFLTEFKEVDSRDPFDTHKATTGNGPTDSSRAS